MMLRCYMTVAARDLRKDDTLDSFGDAKVYENLSHGRGMRVVAYGSGDVLMTIEFPEAHSQIRIERLRDVSEAAAEYKSLLHAIGTETWQHFCQRNDGDIAEHITDFAESFELLSTAQITELARITRAA